MITQKDFNIIIGYFKLILILGVISIHSNVFVDCHSWGSVMGRDIVTFLSAGLTQVCVPAFFILSGYLYFYSIQRFTIYDYKSKLRRRVKTLIIPYILWNLIGAVITLVKIKFLDFPAYGLMTDGNINYGKLIEGFWSYNYGFPYAFAFWFIRNLIIFVLLAPVAYFIARYRNAILAFLIVLCVFNIYIWGFEYFVLGSWIALHIKRWNPKFWLISGSGIVWVLTAIMNTLNIVTNIKAMTLLAVISGFIFLSYTIAYFKDRLRTSKAVKVLVSSTFFIYAIHQFFCTVTRNLFISLFGLTTVWGCVGAYLCSFATLFILSFAGWRIMTYFMPGLTKILGGER